MKTAGSKRVKILSLACIAKRGRREFTVLGQGRVVNGFRRITIIEGADSNSYWVPVADIRCFHTIMVRRLLDRHVKGELRQKPRSMEE
jgi:hypothetical protein